MRKRNKAKHVIKKVILKGNITTKYQPASILSINTKILEIVLHLFAYPNLSVLIHPQNIERQNH